MTLIEKAFLEYARIKLASIENINCGGCGIAALAVYLFLKKHNRIPKNFRIITFYKSKWCDEEFQKNNEFLKGNNSQASPCWHIAFVVDNQILDVQKTVNIIEFEKTLIIPERKTEEFLRSAITSTGWNSAFERSIQIPIIENKLKIKL